MMEEWRKPFFGTNWRFVPASFPAAKGGIIMLARISATPHYSVSEKKWKEILNKTGPRYLCIINIKSAIIKKKL